MRELVLTGHKDTWPVDEKHALFLGPHCFCFNVRHNFFEQNKFQIATSPWKDAQDILEAALYIDDLCDRLIPELSRIMNILYGVSYSEKFWNAYIILWLHNWLGVVYDRYRRLEYAGESFKERFVVKILDEYDPTVSDFQSFFSRTTESHYYNLLLMSDIINHARFDFLDSKKVCVFPEAAVKNKELSFKSSFRKLLVSSKMTVWECLNSFFTSSMFLGTIYGLSLMDRIYLQFSRDPAFLFKKKLSIPSRAIRVTRSSLNKVHLEFEAKNRFEKIVEQMLLKHMPDIFLMFDKYYAVIYPNIKTWVGFDIYTSQKKCFKIASILERGGRWISSQHGGAYGQSMSFPLGKIEYQMAGEFITWGWEHKHIYNSNYRPLPSPMLSKLKKHAEKDDSIVFVGTAMSAYLYRLNNYLAPEQIIDYVEKKMVFLKHLKEGLLQKIKYRPYYYDYGIKETEQLVKMFPKKQFVTEGRLADLFLRVKLAVIDHPCTSFLEALAMNTPVILYWDPAHFAPCKAAVPYFDKLRTVGILHDKPEAAAKKVNEIWPDVSSWWSNHDIQREKNEFCFQFARSSPNWRNEWVQFVKSL